MISTQSIKEPKYVALIETQLIPELQKEGLYTDQISNGELRELAQRFSVVAKGKITGSTTFFGYTEITVDDLSRNISNIVSGMLEENLSVTTDGDYHLLEDDDKNIALKPFMPRLSLGSEG